MIVSKRKPTVMLTLLLLAACSMRPAGNALTPNSGSADPTTTPFLPLAPSPTPEVTSMFLSRLLPAALRQSLEETGRGLNPPVEFLAAPAEGSLTVVPGGEWPLAHWTYAVVAPFPTVRDSIALDELRAAWASSDAGSPLVFASGETNEAMRPLLGEPGSNVRQFNDSERLLDAAWEARPSLAIVPFEALEPRWKVLELDGQSPVRRIFDPSTYPLQVAFGVQGGDLPEEWRRELESAEGAALPLANRRDDRLTTVIVTGVTALTRATAWQMEETGVTRPAQDIGETLRQADVTHISHEVAFAPNCPPPQPDLTALIFCAQPEHIALLEEVGTDVIELTGNHVLDAGTEALLYTLGLYESEGWQSFGGGANLAEALAPALFEHNGNRIGFIGCNEAGPPGAWATDDQPGAAPCGPDRLTSQVQALRDEGYLPIFTFQWHENYVPSATLSQREAFGAAADAGAVAVSGSQAHQPQSFAFRDGAFIHYGLGNLFFDQMWSEDVRKEFIDRYVFHRGRLISVELLTAYLEDWSRPRPMTPEERAAFLDDMFAASGW